MIFMEQLLLARDWKSIGFCGNNIRNGLQRRLAGELKKHEYKILIAAVGPIKLPPEGRCLVASDVTILLDQINEELQSNHVLYIGKSLEKGLLKPYSLPNLAKLMKQLSDNIKIFLDNPPTQASVLHDVKDVQKWYRYRLWNQLIYCLDVSVLDVRRESEPGGTASSRISQNTLVEYFTHPTNGLGELVDSDRKIILYFDGKSLLSTENRAITLSRELAARGLQHVVLGSLAEDDVKRIH